MYLKLYREPPDGDAVRGKLYVAKTPCPSWEKGLGEKGYELLCSTLENHLYLIPPGRYRLTVTYSPKFKRDLPLVNNVQGRSGIRFHPGSKPVHSKGCILISRHDEEQLKTLIQAEKVVLLEVKDLPVASCVTQ